MNKKKSFTFISRYVFLLSALLIYFTLFSSFSFKHKFPDLEMTTVDGRKMDAAYFEKKNTLVVHFFIGCHAAMIALDELQNLQKHDSLDFQILYVAQNTTAHLSDFNSDRENTWSSIRRQYKLEPLAGDVVAICKIENIIQSGSDTIIGEHCNTFAKGIKTKVSPTFVYVDKSMRIRKKEKGYKPINSAFESNERVVGNFR